MKKRIIIVLMLALMMCGCGKVSKLSNGEDAVVSFKENESISVDSLYKNLKERYAINVLIDMIDKEILFKEYEKKLEETEDYADEQMKALEKQYKSKKELLEAIQTYTGYQTIDEYKEVIKLQYLKDLATEDYAKKQITEEQIKTYYKNEVVGDIEASHILITVDIKDDATEDEKKKAEEKALKDAKQIIEKLNKGEDFKKLAKTYSKDDSNKNDGGALGKFNKGEMEANFETAAYKLKVNEYTKEPVKTSYGYHIIKKTKEHEKDTLENLKEEIRSDLATELITSNPTTSLNALTKLRKDKGMNIEDSELKKAYNNYINSMYNYYNTTSAQAE